MMLELEEPDPAYFFASVLHRKDLISQTEIEKLLASHWIGPFEVYEHEYFPMKRYYSKEMGDEAQLQRFFYVFLRPLPRKNFITEKLWAYKQEREHLQNGKRPVNIDIGMITVENLQLATSKKFSHRIYLGDGVYSDLTLQFQGGKFNELPWTYPDYSHEQIKSFFKKMRDKLLAKINECTE